MNRSYLFCFFVIALLCVLPSILALPPTKEDVDEVKCVVPMDNMVIDQDMTFCPGRYYLPHGVSVSGEGIEVNCNKTTLFGNDTTNSHGIEVINRNSITIKACVIKNYDTAVYIEKSKDVSITENLIKNNSRGVYIFDARDNFLTKNIIENNNLDGVVVTTSFNNKISENRIINNQKSGISLTGSDNNTLTKNNLITNLDSGMTFHYSMKNIISYNRIGKNSKGIRLQFSYENYISNNNISNNNNEGVELSFSGSNDIDKNTITVNGENGVLLIFSSSFNHIHSNIIKNNRNNAIKLQGDNELIRPVGNAISQNDISKNVVGIILDTYVENTSINYNNLYDNRGYNLVNKQLKGVDAEFNYWGSADITQINKAILDFKDEPTWGLVIFCPYLDWVFVSGNPVRC